ncbi:MAG: ankyrin repeat domain-containing protein [Pseudomonadota bacterium]
MNNTPISPGVEAFRALMTSAKALVSAFARGEPEARALVQRAIQNERTREFARLRDDAKLGMQGALHVVALDGGAETYPDLIYPLVNQDAQIVASDHPLLIATADNDVDRVATLLAADPSLANIRIRGETLGGMVWHSERGLMKAKNDEPRSTTPLHVACWHLQMESIVKLFIDAGADVNALGYEGNCCGTTCLELACWEGTTGMVEMLLDAGADPNISQPLHQILDHLPSDFPHNDPRKVELLLAHGAQHDLVSALKWDDDAVVRALLEEHPDTIRAFGPRGEAPLDVAKNDDVVQVLYDAMENEGILPPEAAAARGRIDIVEGWLAVNTDIDEPQRGRSMLGHAVMNGQSESVRWLLSNGANPNRAGKTHTLIDALALPQDQRTTIVAELLTHAATATHLATWSKGQSAESVLTLFDALDPNMMVTGPSGQMPLLCLVAGYVDDTVAGDVLDQLIERGANIHGENENGKTALGTAHVIGRDAVVAHLRAKGATH